MADLFEDAPEASGQDATAPPSDTPPAIDRINGTEGSAPKSDKDDAPAKAQAEDKDVDWETQDNRDDDDIQKLISANPGEMPTDIAGFQEKEIDQTGKDDDAVDFEDISDDDLASEGASVHAAEPGLSQVPGLTEDEGTSHDNDNLADLFGDAEGDDDPVHAPASPVAVDLAMPDAVPSTDPEQLPIAPTVEKTAESQQNLSDEQFENLSLIDKIRLNFPQFGPGGSDNPVGDWVAQTQDPTVPEPPQNEEELIQQKFPTFEKHKVLYHHDLFPQWPAEYMYKEPLKEPGEFVPTKLELEIDADTSKLFRLPENALAANQQRMNQFGDDADDQTKGPIFDVDDGVSEESDGNDSLVGGYTLDEFMTICDDWEEMLEPPALVDEHQEEDRDEWDKEFMPLSKAPKKRKFQLGLPDISTYSTRDIDDFEAATQSLGQRVRLIRKDPYLLIDDVDAKRPAKRPKLEEKTKRMASGQLRRDIRHHFNISNDDAYEALKSNHKSKVRAVLSNRSVEHSMPALKLTYPFYRTKLHTEFWNFHRPKLDVEKIVRTAVPIRKPARVKKKDWKGKGVTDTFKLSKDLSLNDNSTAILFEYSEQNPTTLSNFGMGNRVINYYRRKDQFEEDKPPKLDIGEGHTLLPEDRSPFSIFGTVDPGETVPTFHNEMYRAPIFKHEARENDFLLGYTTNSDGPKWYLRNIDHIYAVGQQFPSQDVPGPHARKVTNASKNRLKMIAYRLMNKKESQDVSLHEITPHVFERHDPQNRQKMKEFLSYDRDRKTWVLPDGQTLLDESGIRAMIKPEDVCLIETMMTGQQLLHYAGYDTKNAKDHGDEEDDGMEDSSYSQQAPWKLTKNFIEASAGKAMVALHGEGDPSGHGLGFSFIKTSMKGGYINAVQGPLATSADAIERERKANGGHSYNVKKQQEMYTTAIRQIWERQKSTLGDTTTHDDDDVLDTANEDDRFNARQSTAVPAALVDDGRSQLSRISAAGAAKKKLKIVRRKKNENGDIVTENVILEDPIVIRNYLRQRKEISEQTRDVYNVRPTDDSDKNRENEKAVEKELSRLLRNQDRRQVREKQGKGKKKSVVIAEPGASPDPSSADKASAGTTRKCANCGQVGHIKTNKSKCPLLNGTITSTNNAADHGGFGSFSAPSGGPGAE